MPDYIIVCRGGSQPATPEEGQAHKARWIGWIRTLGEAIVNPDTPLGKSVILAPGGATLQPAAGIALTGYSVVRAGDLDAALKIAADYPFLDMDGATLEVAQIVKMG